MQGVPSIEFDLAYPIRPEEGIEISAKISELRTYCTVQWFGDLDNQSSLQGIVSEYFYFKLYLGKISF